MPLRSRFGSWAFWFQLRQYVKGSLWVVPAVGGLLGPFLALLDLWVDDRIDLPDALTYTASSASGILTAIVGAMVGLLGFVVTIGVLVVQTATNTLSPRFMRIWYRDPLQKAVLATFAGTFTFAFTLLRRVADNHVPSLGVTVAGVLVTLSLLMLLVFLDRFTHVLRPVAVGSLMVRYGMASIADARPRVTALINGPDAPPRPTGRPDLVVRSDRPGVMQAVNIDGLITSAERHNYLLVLIRTPGDFVSVGTPMIEVFAADRSSDRSALDNPIANNGLASLTGLAALNGLVALGIERTIDQDPAFALRILVDIAIRALSPAVNDPTTAVQMLDHIEIFVEAVALAEPRTGMIALADRGGTPRLFVAVRRFDHYLRLATSEIMQYGGASPQVCRRMSAMLESLAAMVRADERPAVDAAIARLDAAILTNFADADARLFARTPDRQGIGSPDTL